MTLRHHPSVGGSLLNADLLYLPALIEDTAVRGHPLDAWSLTPAPYLFPDGVLYGLSRVVAQDIATAVWLTAILQVIALALCARLALAAMAPEHPQLRRMAPVVIAVCCGAGLLGWPLLRHLWWISYHVGVATLILGATALAARRGHARYVLLTAWCAAGGASDALFVVAWGLPAAGAGVVQRFRTGRWDSADTSPGLLLGGAASAAGAVLGRVLLPASNNRSFVLRLERIPQTAASMMRDVAGLDSRLLVAGVIAVVVLGAAWRRWNGDRPSQVARIWIAGCGLTVLAIVSTGNLVESQWTRYLVWPLVCAALLTLGLLPWQRPRWARAVAATAFFGAFALPTWALVGGLRAPADPVDWPRATAQCVDALAVREGATSVIADYWHAKPLTLFSEAGVEAGSFAEDLREPYVWIVSRAWYSHPERAGLVVLDGLDERSVVDRFGEPQERVTCPPVTVLVYRAEGRARVRRFFADASARVGR